VSDLGRIMAIGIYPDDIERGRLPPTPGSSPAGGTIVMQGPQSTPGLPSDRGTGGPACPRGTCIEDTPMRLGPWWLAGLMILVAPAARGDAPPARRTGANPPWPERIPAPRGAVRSPGPWNAPADLSVWPNRTSRSNSDPWLVEHHDQIKRMRPRVLLINFSNEHSIEQLQLLSGRIIRCLAEGSRYHGYAGARAPVFLEYQVFKLVDLSD